jgi:hypothetical protein
MKKHLKILPLVVLFVSLFYACRSKSNVSIKVSESDGTYKFAAYFPENRSDDVMRFIRRQVSQDHVLALDNSNQVLTKLHDGTHFLIRSEPGEILIRLNKEENSAQSLARIKKMCEGIKKEILD